MKKYHIKQAEGGRWSDGFSNSKGGKVKSAKPKKGDDVFLEDGSTILIDEDIEVASINGRVQLYAVEGVSILVNGKKKN